MELKLKLEAIFLILAVIPLLFFSLLAAEILSPELHSVLLFDSVIVSIIVAIVAFATAKSISDPIVRLTKVAGNISKGKFDASVNPEIKESRSEIGQLARTLDEMRLGLKDRSDLLKSLLKSFEGKFGQIATILVRQNVQQLAKKNPSIYKILPKSMSTMLQRKIRMKK